MNLIKFKFNKIGNKISYNYFIKINYTINNFK